MSPLLSIDPHLGSQDVVTLICRRSVLTNLVRMRGILTDEQIRELDDLLMKWKEAFSLHDMELGLTNKVEH